MVVIETERFFLRELTVEDVTTTYLEWLSDQNAQRYITAASTTHGLDDLRQYVSERTQRDDVLFLGIFDKLSNQHIGNLKYEPVDSDAGYAIMGILVGDPTYRGKGVAIEVLSQGNKWLRDNRGITEVVLGVKRDNVAAVKAYERAGFAIETTPYISSNPEMFAMVCRLK